MHILLDQDVNRVVSTWMGVSEPQTSAGGAVRYLRDELFLTSVVSYAVKVMEEDQ